MSKGLIAQARVELAFERAHEALEMAARLVLAVADSYAKEDGDEGAAVRELTAPLRLALDVLDVAEWLSERAEAEAAIRRHGEPS